MNLESHRGPNPLLSAGVFPYFDLPTAEQRDSELRGHVDYLLTSFHEYSLKADNTIRELQQKVASLSEELHELRKQLKDSDTGKPKKRSSRIQVPKDVQRDVKRLYSGAPHHFDAGEKYHNKENDPAREYLTSHLKKKYDGKYSDKQIEAGVHRYYESRRRKYNDKRPQRVEQVAKVKADEAKRKLRRKLYSDRKEVVKNAEERKMWEEINYEYMTDMSEHEEEGEVVIYCYKLSWRSQKLKKLTKKLDKRRVVSKTGKNKVTKSTPSMLPPPPNAPTWIIKK